MSWTAVVAHFRRRADAEMAADLLKQADIGSVIQSPEGMWLGPLSEGTALLVRSDQLEAARAVLRDVGLLEAEA
ncbi:MAG TPA: DUF2007 domain-containing protein [Gemmatimonadales bacterium]|nr:DUF2007 domain-containing protein [Gemmatimonadales bacterium]